MPIKTKCNKIFVLLGNARTFTECFETFCSKMLLNLFEDNTRENTYCLLYLKTDDPGSKNQKLPDPKKNFNFTYHEVNTGAVYSLIDKMEKRYTNVQFVRNIIPTNEKTDEELMKILPNRTLYYDWLSNDVQLKRALQQAYNFQRCDELITEIEKQNNIQFDFYITVRPDLYFVKEFVDISNYYMGKSRSMNQVIGCHDMFFFIPKEKRQGLRVIDFIKNNKTEKIRVTEQLQWGAQGQRLWGPPYPINLEVDASYFLMKRPDDFYIPLVGYRCDPPTEFIERLKTENKAASTIQNCCLSYIWKKFFFLRIKSENRAACIIQRSFRFFSIRKSVARTFVLNIIEEVLSKSYLDKVRQIWAIQISQQPKRNREEEEEYWIKL